MIMSHILVPLSYWLHSLCTAVLIGHFFLLALIYLPVFKHNQANPVSGTILSEISNRSRGWLYGAFVIFIITGIYLMLTNPNYLGLGKFGNTWSVLMLVKHILVVAMLIAGFWFNAILRVGPAVRTNPDTNQALSSFSLYAKLMAIAGALVLLITAASQSL
jgi:uncharacterized membrane protein